MITIGDQIVTLDQLKGFLYSNEQLEISAAAIERVKRNHQFLIHFSTDKIIYGINTGFGPMAQYRVSDEDRKTLQYNLIRSHCSGTGNALDPIYVKAAMIVRLNSFLIGKSGVHESLIFLLRDLINNNITPVVFEHGGVGASGDLVQLAHLGQCLIGEGSVHYKGEIREAAEVFAEAGISPITIQIREGLAVMNGTSFMTGIGVVNLIQAQNLVNWSVNAASLINELIASYDDYFSSELNDVKLHAGQRKVAAQIRERLEGSTLIKSRATHLYKKVDEMYFEDKVQEYYSIRCVPQIVGPISDTIEYATTVIENEVNSVNDNPVVDEAANNIYHGGNFHGDYISLEMDKVKIAITKLAMLAERQVNYLMNSKLNNMLPPFLNKGVLGLNFGLQGVQFTATSTVAECQTLANPMYVHSIPNNNDNQDIVSMGTNSALICSKVIENAYQVIAIELMSITQAIDILKLNDRLSVYNSSVLATIHTAFVPFTEDQPKYKEIRNVLSKLRISISKETVK
ncbi:HAL/PAL/TAL family ammonia-lyase [Cytophaga hutchinsonii]|jgi:histidine ammonia-lyase|uniref:Histidine ammonia-lyase n=1 Tax=Cytophaga hutchinsonii (strain ATCC 33406 / DSM 1761 / CIP 103989 / NBRC 15051 / NCIMB 9469 / D465) TaxID=269798 RepID=A0A6N4SST4_CYTH3|nr:aromatic amino acid ammonia-lyase [Cytophaga hutchinsonii]ABG59387.1 histidine ammonia-lyase [Cytophaga hutchinsonii ATCC 33406]SFX92790.1 histidine ammonia-lyase [Cytophaga hutchinsonii ATCC 33406]